LHINRGPTGESVVGVVPIREKIGCSGKVMWGY
jgi:hypothetical protein